MQKLSINLQLTVKAMEPTIESAALTIPQWYRPSSSGITSMIFRSIPSFSNEYRGNVESGRLKFCNKNIWLIISDSNGGKSNITTVFHWFAIITKIILERNYLIAVSYKRSYLFCDEVFTNSPWKFGNVFEKLIFSSSETTRTILLCNNSFEQFIW